MKKIIIGAALLAGLALFLTLVMTPPKDWKRVYAWKPWYGGHAEFEFTGILRRNRRTEVFIDENGFWEFLDGQQIKGQGHISYARVPNCQYLLDRGSVNQTDLYIYSPTEIRRKKILGAEEVETYDQTSKCFRTLDNHLGSRVTIKGWTKQYTIQTPRVQIPVTILTPGEIRKATLQHRD